MTAIIRPVVSLPNGEKAFFTTSSELNYLRQRNNVLENIFYVCENFWQKYKKPEGMETIENLFIENSEIKPILILLDYKYAKKLNKRDILHSVLPINSVMTNYYIDTKRRKIVTDQIIIEEDVFLGKKIIRKMDLEKFYTKIIFLKKEICFKSALPDISRVIMHDDPDFEELYLMEQ